MKILVTIAFVLLLLGEAPAAETVIYPQLPRDRDCKAIVDQDGANVTVLIRCKGYLDWVVYSGRADTQTGGGNISGTILLPRLVNP
jgi:hypothetical protein